MNLTDALDDAARAAVPDRAGPDPARVLHRIRRRRATRTAGYGVVAVAAVGILALGGSRLPLWDGPGTLPPAGPTALEPPVATVPGVECGQSFADVTARTEPGVALDFAPDTTGERPDATTTSVVTGRLTMTPTGSDDLAVMPDVLDGVGLVVVENDTVIGFGTMTVDDAAAQYPSGVAADARVHLAACSADGVPRGPLAAGRYQAYAVLPITIARGPDEQLRDGFVVSDPVLIEISVTAEPDDDPSDAYLRLPECGESTSGLTTTAGPVIGTTVVTVGTGDPQTGAFTEDPSGDVVQVRTRVTNVGPDIPDATSLVTEGVVTLDDVVVAIWFTPGGDLPPVDWTARTVRGETHGVFPLERCDGGGPLGPGSYTVWSMSVAGRLGTDDPALRVIHEPTQLTIDG